MCVKRVSICAYAYYICVTLSFCPPPPLSLTLLCLSTASPHLSSLSLPQSLPPLPLFSPSLQDHLGEVELFQRDAQKELCQVTQQAEQQQTTPTSHLAELLARGEELGIEVPELDLLRVVRGHCHTLYIHSICRGPVCIYTQTCTHKVLYTLQ